MCFSFHGPDIFGSYEIQQKVNVSYIIPWPLKDKIIYNGTENNNLFLSKLFKTTNFLLKQSTKRLNNKHKK